MTGLKSESRHSLSFLLTVIQSLVCFFFLPCFSWVSTAAAEDADPGRQEGRQELVPSPTCYSLRMMLLREEEEEVGDRHALFSLYGLSLSVSRLVRLNPRRTRSEGAKNFAREETAERSSSVRDASSVLSELKDEERRGKWLTREPPEDAEKAKKKNTPTQPSSTLTRSAFPTPRLSSFRILFPYNVHTQADECERPPLSTSGRE